MLKRLFWPWSEIARLERELSMSDASGYAQYRRAEGLEKIRAKLMADLAHLHANTQPRDPKTGRLVKRGEG